MDARNTRWCSDGLEIGCYNGERVRVAFALDCCDRGGHELRGNDQRSRARTCATSWWPPSSIGSDGSTACPSRSSG